MIQPHCPPDAKLAIIGETPTAQDTYHGKPFMGGSGYELSKILGEAGVSKEACLLSLVCNFQVSAYNLIAKAKKDITPRHKLWQGKYVLPELIEGTEALKTLLLKHRPNTVLACGNLALFALTGEWGVHDWRSSVMESTLIPGLKVIPTISPNTLFAQWKVRPLIVHDVKRAARESATPVIARTEYKFITRPSFEQAQSCLTMLLQRAEASDIALGCDIETRAGHIACIAFAWSETEALCIPLMCQHNLAGYWSEGEEAALVPLMLRLLSKVKVLGHNWNYDAQYIYKHWHFLCPRVEDTMIMQHTAFSNMPKNLAFCSSMYLTDHLYWKDDRTNWTEGPKGEGEDKYWIYNCTDAVRTFAIHPVLRSVLAFFKLEDVNAFQQSLAKRVLRAMNRGIRVDKAARIKVSHELLHEIQRRNAWLENVTGEPLNYKSPKQMQSFFYEAMGQKEIRQRRADGSYGVTTDDEALRTIAEREPLLSPITGVISELRSLSVFHSTFVEAAVDDDGRLRTNLNVCGTETYRFASSKNAFGNGMNMQNIPKGGGEEEGLSAGGML